MISLLSFELKRQQKKALAWALISGVFILVFMALFPSMEKSGIQELVMEKFDAFPREFMEAFGLDMAVNFNDIMHYLAYTIQYIVMALSIYALFLGLDSLLLEESQGTIEFIYGQPLSRRDIYLGKLISHLLVLFESLVLVGLASFFSASLFKPPSLEIQVLAGDILEMFMGTLLVLSLYYFLGLFLGSLLHSGGLGFVMGVFFFTYLLGVLSRIKENLAFLQYLSPFDYALPMDLVREGLASNFLFAGLAACLGFLILSYQIFLRKDFRL